jgi:hypothetical protein
MSTADAVDLGAYGSAPQAVDCNGGHGVGQATHTPGLFTVHLRREPLAHPPRYLLRCCPPEPTAQMACLSQRTPARLSLETSTPARSKANGSGGGVGPGLSSSSEVPSDASHAVSTGPLVSFRVGRGPIHGYESVSHVNYTDPVLGATPRRLIDCS